MPSFNEDDISRFLQPYLSQQQHKDDRLKPPKIQKTQETPAEKLEREAREVVAPPSDMTGVDKDMTILCAKLSHTIYQANAVQDLGEDGVDVTPLLLDDHGLLKATTPTFGVTIKKDSSTMILVWRGSMTKMDWVVDLAVAPILSTSWSNVAPSLRAHAGYTTLVESDLALHKEWLVSQIEKHNITQVLLTGHSLAGAMAQIAQVVIEGEIQNESSPWSRVKGVVSCRSIQFGAPMSCLLLDDDKKSRDFWEQLSKSSCNIVYASDMFPRVPGNFSYVDKAVRHALVPFLRDALPIMSIIDLFPSVHQKLIDMYQDQTKKRDVIDIINVCSMFQHVGSIIYYTSVGEAPVKLDDYRFRTDSKYQYHIPPVEMYPNRRLREDHVKFPSVLATKK